MRLLIFTVVLCCCSALAIDGVVRCDEVSPYSTVRVMMFQCSPEGWRERVTGEWHFDHGRRKIIGMAKDGVPVSPLLSFYTAIGKKQFGRLFVQSQFLSNEAGVSFLQAKLSFSRTLLLGAAKTLTEVQIAAGESKELLFLEDNVSDCSSNIQGHYRIKASIFPCVDAVCAAAAFGPIRFINQSQWVGKLRCSRQGWTSYGPATTTGPYTVSCLDQDNSYLVAYIFPALGEALPEGMEQYIVVTRSAHCSGADRLLVVTLRDSGLTVECQ